MRTLSALALAVAVSCSACGAAPTPAEAPPAPTEPGVTGGAVLEPEVSSSVRGAVAATAPGWTILPLAQVDCGPRVVAVLWPALDPTGAVVDDDVVGLAYERSGGGLRRVGGDLSIRGPDDLGCGAAPFRMRRARVGIPRGEIAEALRARLADVLAAADARDRMAFARATLRLSELFADDAMLEAFTDALVDLLEARVVVEAATLVPGGLFVRARSTTNGRVEEDTLGLLPVPGGADLVVLDVGR